MHGSTGRPGSSSRCSRRSTRRSDGQPSLDPDRPPPPYSPGGGGGGGGGGSRSGAPLPAGRGWPATDQASKHRRASAASRDVPQPVTDRTSTRRATGETPAAASTAANGTPRQVVSSAPPEGQSRAALV